jgi:molybdenum cofactor synthesis domain-containing protein
MAKGGFRIKISLKEALDKVLPFANEVEDESVDLSNALSRVLSYKVVSKMNNPPFDRAMMDGYAVIAKNSFGASPSNPISLRVVGNISAGDLSSTTLKKGEAIKIMTGSPVPKGADAVLKVEYTREEKGIVEVLEPVPPGKNISTVGEDLKKGDMLLEKAKLLKSHDIGVLAATGNLNVRVKKKPKVKIASTGAELLKPGEELKHSSIYDINGYTLSGLVEALGGQPEIYGIIKDDEGELEDVLKSKRWEVLLVSGATSVGEKDFVPNVIGKLGKIIFHGANIRPGGPVGFGVVYDKPVFMLPGFPVACITAFELLVTPFLQKMLGTDPEPLHSSIVGVLEKAIPSQLGRVDFVRVMIGGNEKGLKIKPVSSKGAGLITTLTKAHGFLLVDESREGIEAGENVEVFLL